MKSQGLLDSVSQPQLGVCLLQQGVHLGYLAVGGGLDLLPQLQLVLGLLLGVVPADLYDMALEELGLVEILQDLFALFNQLLDHTATSFQLDERLFLVLDQLVHILDARGRNGGGQHDDVQELNVGLQIVTEGVALPVEVHHDLGLHDGGMISLCFLMRTPSRRTRPCTGPWRALP